MKISSCWVRRKIAGGLVVFLAIPFAQAAAPSQQQPTQGVSAAQDQTSLAVTSAKQVAESYPDNPQPQQPQSNNPSVQAPSVQDSSTRSASAQQPSAPPQAPIVPQPSGDGRPVGTAAAPLERTTGIAASRPAGAVIAPGKQRRARSILIRVSIVVGAAVAIGTVAGLSAASPSKPH